MGTTKELEPEADLLERTHLGILFRVVQLAKFIQPAFHRIARCTTL